MSTAYGNLLQRPTSLFFGAGAKYNSNDVFVDNDGEDQIVPDCSVAPKVDLSPANEQAWAVANGSDADASCHHGFLSTAVHLSLQDVSPPFIQLHRSINQLSTVFSFAHYRSLSHLFSLELV